MTNLYVTDAEIKTYLKITGSGDDNKIAMLNKMATQKINGLLGVSDLSLHLVEAEVHDALGQRDFYLTDMHVQAIGTILDDDTTYTQTDDYDIDNYILRLQTSLYQGKRKGKITYAAGWNAGGYATLTVEDYSTIVGTDTIAIEPGGSGGAETLTEGTDWDAETSNAVTATNIAAAINANATLAGASGVRAFALGAVVYIIDRVPQRESTTVVLGTGTGLSLSVSPLSGVDFPEDLREAVMFYVAAKLSTGRSVGVRRFRIGTKEVSYQSDKDVMNELKAMLKHYKRAFVSAV